MTTTDAVKYLPQMGLDPLKVVGCAAARCQNSFVLANGFAVEVTRWRKQLHRLLLFSWLLSQ
jgi:hypothetical protein